MTHEKTDTQKRMTNEEQIKAEEDVRYYKKLAEMPDEVQEGMDLLEKQRPIDLKNIKESCKFELQRFINMRGSIDKETGKIHIPFMTISEQNTGAIIKQIETANNLLISIEVTKSVDEINDALQNLPSNLGDDLDAVIGKCMVITGVSRNDGQSNKI